MKWIFSVLGWAVFVVAAGHFVLAYGSHWEFGRYGMPRALVAADGVHYVDGTEIDPVTLGTARTGTEEETMLVGLSATALVLAYAVFLNYRIIRQREQLRKKSPKERVLMTQNLQQEPQEPSRYVVLGLLLLLANVHATGMPGFLHSHFGMEALSVLGVAAPRRCGGDRL